MSSVKVLFFYVFLLIAIINTILMYSQTSVFTIQSFSAALFTIVVLVLSALLTLISLKSERRAVKKASYRVELLSLFVLIVISTVARINEIITGVIDISLIWRIGATLLYVVVFLFVIGLSRDLFKELLKIYNNKNNN